METKKERKMESSHNNDYSNLKALFLNCTIKPSPEVSHTQGLCDDVAKVYEKEHGIKSSFVRVIDYNVPSGLKSDMGNGDEWPLILEKIKESDI
ncbi:MAG: flavodoxin family protein, partial [Bacteroidetes bacterium]|nr:flavodoxin family protein [Bacteroidota bacterium]